MNDKNSDQLQYFEYDLIRNVRLESLNEEKIAHAKNGQFDYTAYDPESGIGLTEAKGRRQSQEDRSDFDVSPELMELNDQQLKAVLIKTFDYVQQRYGSTYESGATLVTALFQKNKLYIANIGDSNAILLLMDQHKNIICQRLNVLHNPSTPSEYEYIMKNEGYIQHDRLGGMLAVSRAIGDNDFEQYGLRHTPDIFVIDLSKGNDEYNNQIIKPNHKILGLLLACDGLHEEDSELLNMSERIKQYIDENHLDDIDQIQLNTQQISQLLVYGAYDDGSYDNLTAMLIPLNVNLTSVIIAMVADGHGGSEVAEALGKNFIPFLIKNVRQQKAKK